MDTRYLVWSHEHHAWWAPGRRGYSYTLSGAGTYSRDEALDIVSGATVDWTRGLPNELPVRIADLPGEAQNLVPNQP